MTTERIVITKKGAMYSTSKWEISGSAADKAVLLTRKDDRRDVPRMIDIPIESIDRIEIWEVLDGQLADN
jgi:hypothetical protein